MQVKDKLENCLEEAHLVSDGAKVGFQVSSIPDQVFYKQLWCQSYQVCPASSSSPQITLQNAMLLVRIPQIPAITVAISSRYKQKLPSKASLRIFAKNGYLDHTLDLLSEKC